LSEYLRLVPPTDKLIISEPHPRHSIWFRTLILVTLTLITLSPSTRIRGAYLNQHYTAPPSTCVRRNGVEGEQGNDPLVPMQIVSLQIPLMTTFPPHMAALELQAKTPGRW